MKTQTKLYISPETYKSGDGFVEPAQWKRIDTPDLLLVTLRDVINCPMGNIPCDQLCAKYQDVEKYYISELLKHHAAVKVITCDCNVCIVVPEPQGNNNAD